MYQNVVFMVKKPSKNHKIAFISVRDFSKVRVTKKAYNFYQDFFFIIPFAAVTGLSCPDKKLADFSFRPPKVFSQFFDKNFAKNWLKNFECLNEKSANFGIWAIQPCNSCKRNYEKILFLVKVISIFVTRTFIKSRTEISAILWFFEGFLSYGPKLPSKYQLFHIWAYVFWELRRQLSIG